MIEVREERQEDIGAVREVNMRAFGQTAEASIVDALRERCPGLLSLVAVDSGRIVGHVLFSPVVIECEGRSVFGMGLAPMSVCLNASAGVSAQRWSTQASTCSGNADAPL